MGPEEHINKGIEEQGSKYTAMIFHRLKGRDKRLTVEEADMYHIVQQAHLRLTGYSLPPIKGARKTRAQARDEQAPEVKEEVIVKAVKGGLAAKIARMRRGK